MSLLRVNVRRAIHWSITNRRFKKFPGLRLLRNDDHRKSEDINEVMSKNMKPFGKIVLLITRHIGAEKAQHIIICEHFEE